jgi:hypothetical protein
LELGKRLPKIPVPLRKSDAGIAVDVQELINLAYRRGRYDDIDYSKPPDPPFEGDDARWIGEVLRRP